MYLFSVPCWQLWLA